MSTRKVYSVNNEEFNHNELGDAVEDCYASTFLEVGETTVIYAADSIGQKASNFIPDIVEYMQEIAYEECGEYVDTWPDATQSQRDNLNRTIGNVVNVWADQNNLKPKFYKVENIKEIKIKLLNEDCDYEVISQ